MITIAQAAAMTGKSSAWLRRQVQAGKIKGQKITERMWLVDEASLREWISKSRKVGRPKK